MKHIKAILSLASVGMLFYIIYHQREEIKQLKANTVVDTLNIKHSNVEIIDSLNEEIFNLKAESGRNELSLEHLKETDPKAAEEFENFYNHETE